MNQIHLMHQGIAPERSMANKGGGGGGSSTPYYANMDALYGQQARAAGYMLDTSMPYIPEYMANSNTMVNDAMNGTLANQMRQVAGNDAAAANGASWGAVNRNMSRMGAGMSADRMLSEANKNSIMGAANTAGAMNRATMGAEDMKWNRNAGAFGQATGMSSGAMDSLGSAARGYGAAGNSMAGYDAMNAAGMGQFGAAMAKSFMADGGYVKAPGLATGGDPWAAYKAANPVKTVTPTSQSTSSQLGLIAAGAAPYLIGAGLKKLANSDVAENAWNSIKNGVASATQPAASDADVINSAREGAEASAGAIADNGPQVDFLVQGVGDTGAVASDGITEGMTKLFADLGDTEFLANGGYIKKPGLNLAMGGIAKSMRMPSVASMDASSSMKLSQHPAPVKMPSTAKSSGVAQQAQQTQGGVSPGAAAQAGKKAYEGVDAINTADKAKDAADAASMTADAAAQTGDVADTINTAVDAANAADAANTAASAADGAGGANPATAALKLGADLISGRDAGTAVADAALTYGGTELGATIGSAAGPIGTVIGGALGGLLGGSLFAKGGLAQGREDYRPGGKVAGPGTETSDDIPAWLSKGEYVLNAEAVKQVGKAKLDKLNKAGLKQRESKDEREERGYAKGGKVKPLPTKREEIAEGTPGVIDSVVEERRERFRGNGRKIDRRADSVAMAKSAGLSLAMGGYVKKGC